MSPDEPKNQARKNQGEGDRESADRYNKDLQRFVKTAQAKHAAREAVKAMDGPEGPELRKAEERGKARAKEEDPEEKRNYRKPS